MNSNFCDGLRASLRPLWMRRTEPAQFSFFLAAIIEPNSCSADIGNLFDTSSKFPNETIKWASSSGRHIKAAGCWQPCHVLTFGLFKHSQAPASLHVLWPCINSNNSERSPSGRRCSVDCEVGDWGVGGGHLLPAAEEETLADCICNGPWQGAV